ncbi:Carrier protein, mitochondrial [Malassezia sp. CBS 17886]|nr:Carrier protein, mitochondrial [Malassezia sp. CBS 17886]
MPLPGVPQGEEEERRVPMTQAERAAAAICGAVSSSVLMTPLDVVKTRLQTQAPDNAWDAPVRPARPARGLAASSWRLCHANTEVLHCFARNFNLYRVAVAEPVSAQGAVLCVYPGKCTPSVCEIESVVQGRHMNGVLDGIAKVARQEGLRGLWRGLVPTVAMTVPSQVTYMSCYDVFRRMLMRSDAPSRVRQDVARDVGNADIVDGDLYIPDFALDRDGPRYAPPAPVRRTMSVLLAPLAAGALARSISATLVTPLELLRTRLQASSGRSSFVSVIRPLWFEVQQQGPAVLWRGLGATLWRDVPFSAFYFSGYEVGKSMLTGGGFGEGPATSSSYQFGVSFVVGASSGGIAALATHPFDVYKTRLQAETNEVARPIFAALSEIYRTEGARGLMSGVAPRLAKVAPSCGIMIASYEVVGHILSKERRKGEVRR